MIKKLIFCFVLLLPSLSLAQTIQPPYFSYRYQTATTCSNLTNGKFVDLCIQSTDKTLWACFPNAGQSGTCNTSGEWYLVSGSGGGGGITNPLTADLNANGYNLTTVHYLYFGDPNTNGSWRMYVGLSGNLQTEYRQSGTWVYKGSFNQ